MPNTCRRYINLLAMVVISLVDIPGPFFVDPMAPLCQFRNHRYSHSPCFQHACHLSVLHSSSNGLLLQLVLSADDYPTVPKSTLRTSFRVTLLGGDRSQRQFQTGSPNDTTCPPIQIMGQVRTQTNQLCWYFSINSSGLA